MDKTFEAKYGDDTSSEEEFFDDDEVFDDEDIESAPVENLGIRAYAHWNEEAAQMWWLEEGRFG